MALLLGESERKQSLSLKNNSSASAQQELSIRIDTEECINIALLGRHASVNQK